MSISRPLVGCAIVDSVSYYDDQPSTYGNENWALFCVVERFQRNPTNAKRLRMCGVWRAGLRCKELGAVVNK